MTYIKKAGGVSGMTEARWREVELLAYKGHVVEIRRRPADSEDSDDPLIKVRWLDGARALSLFKKSVYFVLYIPHLITAYSGWSPKEMKAHRKTWQPRQLIKTADFDVVAASSVFKSFDTVFRGNENDAIPTDANTWFIWAVVTTPEEERQEEDEAKDAERNDEDEDEDEKGKMKGDVDMKAPRGKVEGRGDNDEMDVDTPPLHDERENEDKETDHAPAAKDTTMQADLDIAPAVEERQRQGLKETKDTPQGKGDEMPRGDVDMERTREKQEDRDQDQDQGEGEGEEKEDDSEQESVDEAATHGADMSQAHQREHGRDVHKDEQKQDEENLDATRQRRQEPENAASEVEAAASQTPVATVVDKPCPPEGSSWQEGGQKTGNKQDACTSAGDIARATSSAQGPATVNPEAQACPTASKAKPAVPVTGRGRGKRGSVPAAKR